MSDKAKAMVWASFAADALALGPHWEYDPQALASRFGRVTTYLTPLAGSYHAGKAAGDLTHYGDQTLVLLESLAGCHGFDLGDFARRWRALFADYKGYVDGASRRTLAMFEFDDDPGHGGSPSNDLAGASRIAPLVYALRGDLDALVAAVRAQTRLTHNHAQVIAAAEFFARTAWHVLVGGISPVTALGEAAKAEYDGAPVSTWLAEGLASAEIETVTAIGRFGRSCHIDEAMPGVIHLIARHADDLPGCLSENVMAGGDSAARGMLAGMILGAAHGLGAIPSAWIEGLTSRRAIEASLTALDH